MVSFLIPVKWLQFEVIHFLRHFHKVTTNFILCSIYHKHHCCVNLLICPFFLQMRLNLYKE